MKILLTISILGLSFNCFSQNINWSPAVLVSSSAQGNNHPRITLDRNGNPLLIWGRSSGKEAFFSRWDGSAFTAPVMLNSMMIPVFTDSWAGPDITSFGDTVYAVFKQAPEDSSPVYMVRSTNGGQTFGSLVRVDNIGDSASRFPTVTTDAAGNPVVAFMKFNQGFTDPRYVVSRSTDLGNTFMTDARASAAGEVCDCCPGAVLSSGNKVAMLYRNNLSSLREIWAGFSPDNGNSFSNGIPIDNSGWMISACPSSGPDGIIIGDSLYTVFMSGAGGGARVYLSRASILTEQLAYSGRLTGNFTGLTAQNFPRIANSGNAASIVWKENASGKARVCMNFTSSIAKGFPANYDTLFTGSLSNVDVAMAEGVIHVIWEDDASGTVMYRKGTYEPSLSAEESTLSNNTFQIYPNPAPDFFTVPFQNISSCILTDISGREFMLQTETSPGDASFSISDMRDGLYFVSLRDENGNQYFSKLLVQAAK